MSSPVHPILAELITLLAHIETTAIQVWHQVGSAHHTDTIWAVELCMLDDAHAIVERAIRHLGVALNLPHEHLLRGDRYVFKLRPEGIQAESVHSDQEEKRQWKGPSHVMG
jgi:hypothetical protein